MDATHSTHNSMEHIDWPPLPTNPPVATWSLLVLFWLRWARTLINATDSWQAVHHPLFHWKICYCGHHLHSTSTCVICPICMGPHREENHWALAACYKGHPKQVPPVPPTADGGPCPHLALCKNFSKPHAANSPCCQFWQHCFNHFWIVERYAKTDDLQSCAHPLTGETGIRRKATASRGRSGDGGEA